MANLIRGKQIINGFTGTTGNNKGEITPAHLWMTGSTVPSNGQVPAYEASSGKFLWVTPTNVQTVSGITAVQTLNAGGPNVTFNVRTDGGFNPAGTIYVDGNNNLTLGDPATSDRLITGNLFSFSNDLIVYGNLTVNGTATTVNSETVTIADNFIELNSNFTAGTPTQNAGIEVRRGNEANVVFRWNEVNDWWEVTNPEGTGNTYSAILTTSSVESSDPAIVVTQGLGSDADKIYLSISEANLSNIPNSALTNSTITVVAGSGLGGGGTVALGGSITLSATPVSDFYVTGGTATYGTSNVGTLTLNRQNGSVNISIEDTFVTGGTLVGSNIILGRNDGQTVTVDLSALDVNDTYSTGGTATSATNTNNAQSITINGNSGFVSYSITGLTDTYVTGGTLVGSNIVLTQNNGSQVSIDISSSDFNDTYVTGGTSTGATNSSNQAVIDLTYNQGVAPGTYSLNYEDTYVTGGSVNNGTLTLTRNDAVSTTISGTILQSVTAQNGLTATTTNGAVTIGIGTGQVTNQMLQNSSINVTDDNVVTASTSVSLGGTLNVGLAQNSVNEAHLYITGATATNGQYLTYDAGSGGFAWVTPPAAATFTPQDKGLTPAVVNTDATSTTLTISLTPATGSYVGVSVNGVWYEVGNGVDTKDCYFVDPLNGCGGGVFRSQGSIQAGDILCWNGASSIALDGADRVDMYYDA